MWIEPAVDECLRVWQQRGGAIGKRSTDGIFAEYQFLMWLSARFPMVDLIENVRVATPPGIRWSRGFWMRLTVDARRFPVDWRPSPGCRRSYHGTSLACLHRIIVHGMQAGWDVKLVEGRPLTAIYSHAPEYSHQCLCHTLYTALDSSGWLYGPFIELESPHIDPGHRRSVLKGRERGISDSKSYELLSYEDTIASAGVWVNAVHLRHCIDSDPTGHFRVFAEPQYQTQLEIHPDASWEELAQWSHEARHEDL